MFKYHLYGSRYGGEHTIGTIPIDVAEYWLDKGADAFEDYMLDWEHDEINMSGEIPEKYQLPNWYEVDNIEHLCSIEFEDANVIVVQDITNQKEGDMPWNGKVITEIDLKEDLLGTITNPFENNNDWKGDNVLVYGQSFEKGGCNFETLITEEPFDASKVKCDVTQWDTILMVDGINYDGEFLSNEGMEGIGKSMSCWIDY